MMDHFYIFICFLLRAQALKVSTPTDFNVTDVDTYEPQTWAYNFSETGQISGVENFDIFINGTEEERLLSGTAANANQFPFVVFISSTVITTPNPRGCTGAILSSEYVLTAASCVYDASQIQVTPATLDGTGTATPGTAIVFPKYYSNTQVHDIALVKLAPPLVLSPTITTINLSMRINAEHTHVLAGRRMRVYGFGGATAGGPAALTFSDMSVLSDIRCYREMKKRNIRPALFQNCLDTDSGTLGMCNLEDKGGLVTAKFEADSTYTLVGILNYYYTCGSNTPNLFTRLGPYLDFIRKYVPAYENSG